MSNGPPSGHSPVPVVTRKVASRPVVKILLPAPGKEESAVLYSEDRKVVMALPAGAVSKRFPPGQREGYFKCDLFDDGVLEIGERVPAPEPAW